MTTPSLRSAICLAFFLHLTIPFFRPPSAGIMAQEEVPLSTQELTDVAQTLRSHYYDRAWELGSIVGKPFAEKAPDAFELQAWYALNLSRDGYPEKGIAVAESLMERDSESPWAWFAYAGSLFRDPDRHEEALEASEKAVSLAPDNLDFLSLRADVIRTVSGLEEAMAFIESLPPEQAGHPLLQIRKAIVLDYMAKEEDATVTQEEAYDFFRQVMALDTTFLEPVFFLASRLQSARRNEEALPLLKKGAALSPSFQVHEYYWRGIQAQRDITPEERDHQLEDAIQAFIATGGETPGALLAMSRIYEAGQKMEVRDSLWGRILVESPESTSAEWVLVNRYREMNKKLMEQEREGKEQDPALKARYRRALELFLMRPKHIDERLKGDAYRQMLYLLRDDDEVDPEFLYSVVRGIELYEGINTHIIYGMAPTILADHHAHLSYAEELARKGIVKVEEQMAEYKERGVFNTEEEYEASANNARSTMADALGWVFLAQGRIEDAESKLLEGYQLFKNNSTLLLHLGKLYERRHALALEEGQEDGAYLDQAQDFYLKGTLVPSPGTNPNDEALRDLYTSRHGNLEGFEEFLADASKTDADHRRDAILGQRLEEPKALTPFSMELLAGGSVSSDELKGKVVVLNFWGVWCGPCVIETPGIQAFYDQYKDDDEVVILTLSNDQNPDVVRRFMETKEFNFPVLLDVGYVDEVDVHAFPTTWFIDRDGSICFEKRGWSEELAQEFAWRVEALRGG